MLFKVFGFQVIPKDWSKYDDEGRVITQPATLNTPENHDRLAQIGEGILAHLGANSTDMAEKLFCATAAKLSQSKPTTAEKITYQQQIFDAVQLPHDVRD